MLVTQTTQKFSAVTYPDLAAYVGGYILIWISNPTNNNMYSTVQLDYEGLQYLKEKKYSNKIK